METVMIYLLYLYLMTKLFLNAVEQEKWWLAASLAIITIGAMLYYHSR